MDRRVDRRGGRLLAALLVGLIAIRAAVPLGFMPDMSRLGDGVLEIVICSPAGVERRAVGATGVPAPPGHTDTAPADHGLCPFAAAAALALAAALLLLLASVGWPPRLRLVVPTPDLAPLRRPGPLGPRAPPRL